MLFQPVICEVRSRSVSRAAKPYRFGRISGITSPGGTRTRFEIGRGSSKDWLRLVRMVPRVMPSLYCHTMLTTGMLMFGR